MSGWLSLVIAVAFWLHFVLIFLFGWAVLTDRRIVFNWAGFPWKKIDFPVEQVRELVIVNRKLEVIPRNGPIMSSLIPDMHSFVEEFDDLVRMGAGYED